MEILKTKVIKIDFFAKKKYCKVVRFSTETEADWKESVLQWSELNIKYKPVYLLVDERLFDFMITPNLQLWTNEKLIKPAVMSGAKRVALISNDDIFVQTAVEQLLDEKEAKPLEIMYFTEVEKAEKWLFR